MIDERPSMVHDLKSWPRYFADMVSELKQFEYRKADRDYRVGDVLLLREWDPDRKDYTGRMTTRVVTYILDTGDVPGGGSEWFVLGWDPPSRRGEES